MILNHIKPYMPKIHQFWFKGYPQIKGNYGELMKFWFQKDPKLDSTIKNEFQPAVNFLLSDQFNVDKFNVNEYSIQEVLSATIALDQFTRNIFRDDPKSFQGDPKALALSKKILSQESLFNQYASLEKMFILMPLEHSENMDDQLRSLDLFKKLAESEQEEDMKPFMKIGHDYAIAHMEIIERFGRFPHRNQILERINTAEEDHYLNNGGITF